MSEYEKLAKIFNAAYLMQKHDPELADKISRSSNGSSEYAQAFQAGAQQQLKDKIAKQQKTIKDRQEVKKPKR